MESIYYVLCWHCHRRCTHCYEDRFRPYSRDALAAVVAQARRDSPRIIDNLPDTMLYRPRDGGALRVGRIVLSGGDVLTDPVREAVLYPAIERLMRRFAATGGVRLAVQTTGDLIVPRILDELLERGVWMVSPSGFDDYHVGFEGDRRQARAEALLELFASRGVRPSVRPDGSPETEGPVYSLFGATADSWIGKLWPRGRAWANGLSTAGLSDNFCAAWSGGKGFLDLGQEGAEVSVEPDGNVYPCCLKTKAPLGNLTEERLEDILGNLRGHPALEAINRGRSDEMGLELGWDRATFAANSATETPQGKPYANLCIGCDRFHAEVLGPVLARLRQERLAARAVPTLAAE